MVYDDGSACTYNISINKAEDELTDKNITLSDTNEMNISIDYINDIDRIHFTVLEKTFLSFKLKSNIFDKKEVSIKDADGNEVFNYTNFNSYGSNEIFIYLIPGDFTIEVKGRYWGEIIINLNKTTSFTDDYPSVTSDESEMGVLYEGDNTISINYPNDKDMYVFNVLNDGIYFFHQYLYQSHGDKTNFQLIDETGEIYNMPEKLSLKKGKYYVYIQFQKATETGLLIFNYDENSEDEEPLTMIEPINNLTGDITGNINHVNDEDVYQLTLNEDGLLHGLIKGFSSSLEVDIYNEQNQLILDSLGLYKFNSDGIEFISNINVFLKAGIYTIKIKDTVNGHYPYKIMMNQNIDIIDDFSNNLITGTYGTLSIGDYTINIDHKNDIDVFTLNLDSDQIIYFNFNNNHLLRGYIYEQDHTLICFFNTNWNINLKAGTYYIKFYSFYPGAFPLEISIVE